MRVPRLEVDESEPDTGGSAPRAGSHVADWHDPEPGFLEVDLVVHCGESMAGSFASTLVLTDIASGWIECVALLVREGSLIVDALERLRATLPFPLRASTPTTAASSSTSG